MTPIETPPTTQPALTRRDSAAYLSRLGADRPEAPTLGALASLHRRHLLTVPFENLDIALGRRIRLDTASLVRKVVKDRRGGYCYELNGLFASLLGTMSYAAQLASARVTAEGGGLSEEFDHLALLVTSTLLPEPHLVDVGFGDAFLEPIALRDGVVRQEAAKRVGLVTGAVDGEWAYREDHGGGWETQYVFTAAPRALADFEPRNVWQQTSPKSHFTGNRVASLATETGRITLSNRRLITTVGDRRTEREIDPADVGRVLAETFGIALDDADTRRLADLDGRGAVI